MREKPLLTGYANLNVKQISPFICRWKLVKILDWLIGDNRKTKDTRKIKLCSLEVFFCLGT